MLSKVSVCMQSLVAKLQHLLRGHKLQRLLRGDDYQTSGEMTIKQNTKAKAKVRSFVF